MPKKIAFVIDPVDTLIRDHDSTISLMRAAMALGCKVFMMTIDTLFADKNQPFAMTNSLNSMDLTKSSWYETGPLIRTPLADFDIIMMRKDPPFDMRYIFSTYLLELSEKQGVRVYNKPSSLRDHNEKLFILDFPDCIADTIVSAKTEAIQLFHQKHGDIIIKPLDGMGGKGIFRVKPDDDNLNVMVEMLSNNHTQYIMAQKYLPEIEKGDKRILLVNGEPLPFALCRLPQKGEFRANLALGGKAQASMLTERDKWICEKLSPTLKGKGLFFVGIDVIGDYLTEINVTCPTCIREIDTANNVDLGMDIMRQCLAIK